LQLVDQRGQMLDATPKPIEAPADDQIEAMALGLGQHRFKRWTMLLRG